MARQAIAEVLHTAGRRAAVFERAGRGCVGLATFSVMVNAQEVPWTEGLRSRLDQLLDEHRAMLQGSLVGLTEEEARRHLVPSRTTLLGLVKHVTYVEQVWFNQALTGTSLRQLGAPATPDLSFILHESDTIDSVLRAYTDTCANSRRLVASIALEEEVSGRGRRALWAIYTHMLRELAQHCGHADILREQILASRT